MHISQKGLDLIKEFEGLRLKAYQCSAKKWTIGYGHTNNVRPDDEITELQALELLIRDVYDCEGAINRLVTKTLNQGQLDSLCSFIFNVGIGNFQKSTLLRLLNEGDFIGASKQFERWVYCKGKKLNGLVRRRKAEKQMFLSSS